MLSTAPLLETTLDGLTLHRRGKVRDVYEVDGGLLIVATDRISAFDYVLGSGIPDKGKVLTQLSAFWFERMGDLVPHHLISSDLDDFPAAARRHAELLRGRTMLVPTHRPRSDRMRRARVPVRIGLEGIPADRQRLRREAAGRPARVGPSAGADLHPGDEGRHRPRHQHQRGRGGRLVGRDLIARLKALTLEIYRRGAAHAESKGIIIADTKFEFGLARRSGDLDADESSSSTKC